MNVALAWLIYGVILAVMAGVLISVVFGVVTDMRDRWRDYQEWNEARDLERARSVTGRVK